MSDSIQKAGARKETESLCSEDAMVNEHECLEKSFFTWLSFCLSPFPIVLLLVNSTLSLNSISWNCVQFPVTVLDLLWHYEYYHLDFFSVVFGSFWGFSWYHRYVILFLLLLCAISYLNTYSPIRCHLILSPLIFSFLHISPSSPPFGWLVAGLLLSFVSLY